jgi:hypothetical protein
MGCYDSSNFVTRSIIEIRSAGLGVSTNEFGGLGIWKH